MEVRERLESGVDVPRRGVEAEGGCFCGELWDDALRVDRASTIAADAIE